MKIYVKDLLLNTKLKAKHLTNLCKTKQKEKEKKLMRKYFQILVLLCDSSISFLTLSAAKFHNWNQLKTRIRKTSIQKATIILYFVNGPKYIQPAL